MNRRNFLRDTIIPAAIVGTACLPAIAFEQTPDEPMSGAQLLIILQTAESALNGLPPPGTLTLNSFAEVEATIRQTAGESEVNMFKDGFFGLGDAANWAGACAGGGILGQTRLTRAGTIALARVCIGFGWSFMIGWNAGTVIYVVTTNSWLYYRTPRVAGS